jgi:ribosome-interacting GTPase 1
MVTNLPVEAKVKWMEVSATRVPQEKVRLMREFLSLCPKHKGTAKLLAQVKSQMSLLQREIETKKAQKKRAGPKFFFEKEGAAQIAILGPTNVGRSSFLAAVTNANPLISPAPYTTVKPIPGMLPYKDIQFQLVEVPALIRGAADGKAGGLQTLSLARNADGLIVMVDLANRPLEQLLMVTDELEKARLLIEPPLGQVEIIRQSHGVGVRVVGGRLAGCTVEDVGRLLADYRIQTAMVKIHGKVTLEDIENSIFTNALYKPTIVVANKSDLLEAKQELADLMEFVGKRLQVFPVSSKYGQGLEKIGEALFKMLDIIRVYTKDIQKKEPSPEPIVVKAEATVIDIAKLIHSEFFRNFKYARIWGPSAKYPGEKVGSKHILEDGDILEIHA